MSMPDRIKGFPRQPLCWGYAQSSLRCNPIRSFKPAFCAPKVPRPSNRRWSPSAYCGSPKWLTLGGIPARLREVGSEKYVTDVALTAQAVETPCIPPLQRLFLPRFGFLFAVDVTEMAKLGPERYRIPNQTCCGILIVHPGMHLNWCDSTSILPAKGVEQVVH
jgi:hypothetical protein